MTHELPLLVVSLPDRSIDALRARVAGLAGSSADLAELRVDRLSPGGVDRLGELFPTAVPLVATYRSRREGGEGSDDLRARQAVLGRLAELPFAYLDLERATDLELLPRLPANPARRGIIVSTHLADDAPLEQIQRALGPVPVASAIAKAVLPASVERLYGELRPTLDSLASTARPLILHTTGPSGPILRVRGARYGLAAVFASPPLSTELPAPNDAVESAQPPLDALAALLRADSGGRLFALLGHPVAHSVSPRMHTLWYRAEDRPALFVALDIASATEFSRVLDPLQRDGFCGFNITHPWKEAALAAAGIASQDASTAGCANTLTYESERWQADNFDVTAVVHRAEELRAFGLWTGDDILILGSGGAARAGLAAARHLNASARVLARRPEAAERLAREFGAEVERGSSHQASFVLHATPAGRPEEPKLELDWEPLVGPGTVVVDFVYAAARSTFAARVRELGARYEDGGRLLVYQAREVHRRWWGEYPAPALVDRALAEVGCAA